MTSPTTSGRGSPPPAAGKLITMQEAADILGVPVSTLRYWRWKRVPGVPWGMKIGRSVRYSRSNLNEYIARAERTAG